MRKLIGVVVVLVGVLGLLIGAELWARSSVVSHASDPIQQYLGVEPEVTVAGPLVLPQIIGGRINSIEASADQLTYEGVTVTDARGTVRGLSTAEPFEAASVWVAARLGPEELNRLYQQYSPIGGQLTSADGVVNLEGEVLGQQLAVGFEPVAGDNAIVLRPHSASLNQVGLDLSALATFLGGIDSEITIPLEVPEGFRITVVRATPDGIEVEVLGTNVQLAYLDF
ncbi:MAG TPA: DUF2993 domain-containing protein [Actinomycetaceae bacterium]|nr:DUF2993 domain-containing protein [Actinomycetaceae bacterium]